MLYNSKKWLYQKYWNEELNPFDISNICKCMESTIKKWLEKHNIRRLPIEEERTRTYKKQFIKKYPELENLINSIIKRDREFADEIILQELWGKSNKIFQYIQSYFYQIIKDNNISKISDITEKAHERMIIFNYRSAMVDIFRYYMSSPAWNIVKNEVYERDNNRCVDCAQGEGKLIVHHTSYDNWGKGNYQEIEDCILVCPVCHNKRHRDNSVKVPFWAKIYPEDYGWGGIQNYFEMIDFDTFIPFQLILKI